MNVSVSAGVGMYLYIDKFIVIGITHYNCFIEYLNILVYLCMHVETVVLHQLCVTLHKHCHNLYCSIQLRICNCFVTLTTLTSGGNGLRFFQN